MYLVQAIDPFLQEGTIHFHALDSHTITAEDVDSLKKCHGVREDLPLTSRRILRAKKGDECNRKVEGRQGTPFVRLDSPFNRFTESLWHSVDPRRYSTIFDHGLDMVNDVHCNTARRVQRFKTGEAANCAEILLNKRE